MTKLALPGAAGRGMQAGPEDGVQPGAGGSEGGCDCRDLGVSVRAVL